MSSHVRALAARLGELNDAALIALFDARTAPQAARWADTFDAAEWLLDAASITAALAELTRPELDALVTASEAGTAVTAEARPALDALALLNAHGTPYVPVAEQATAWAATDAATPPAAAGEADTADTPDASDLDAATAAAAERAFTSVGALSDILLETLATPLTRLVSGTVGANDRRRLAEDAVPRAEDIDALIGMAVSAELLALVGRQWLVTPAGEQWMRLPTLVRHTSVAQAWRAALPRGIHVAHAARTWRTAYPADATWPAKAAALEAQAEAWGLIDATGSATEWAALLWAGSPDPSAPADGSDASAAQASLGARLPSEVESVYLQNDLTAIAPGPLAPALDLRLRTMARRESHAQASTYRFTAETIAAAVTAGETAESMRAFLTTISVTGMPQPLDYLITSAAERHGMIRVQAQDAPPREPGGPALRTLVTTDDPALVDTLLVDQSLQALGLVRSGDGLHSRVARDVVYWSLIDARYPAAAIDETGAVAPLHRHKLASTGTDEPSPAERYEQLVTTLRSAPTLEGDDAWRTRELEIAVRARETLTLMVAHPSGEERAFTMELTGIGGGRVRGRDKLADLERTLPLSSITAVRRE